MTQATTSSIRASRFATAVLVFGAILCAIHVGFAYQLKQRVRVKAVPAVAAVVLLACLRLRVERRVNVALGVVPVILGLHGFELILNLSRKPAASAASAAGRPYDSRGKPEVIDDLRAQGFDATTAVLPKLLSAHLNARRKSGVTVAGESLLALGGIARVKTVLCNEGGEWVSYDADEHGFNNPLGIWSSGPIDVAVVGDSYTHGLCVRTEQTFPGRIREKRPKTLSLGMGGNGPLFELGTIREYLHAARPKDVVWAYFRNDLDDLEYEASLPLMRRYVEDPSFSQHLIEKQDKIDQGLRGMVEVMLQDSPRWPRWLAARGITRLNTPVVFHDLLMSERNTVASAVIRLDSIHGGQKLQQPVSHPKYDLFKKILATAKTEVASWGGRLHFLHIPDTIGLNSTEAHRSRERVLAIVAEVGLPLIDAHEGFKGHPIEGLRYTWRSHLNPEGYALLGRIVNDHLDAHDARPGGP